MDGGAGEGNRKELPNGWESTPLHAVTTHQSGDSKIIKGCLSSHESPDSFPAFSATGQDVWRSEYAHEGDAIIVSAVGARCGKCFLASGKWSAIANTHIVWPESDDLDIRFIWYRLNDERFWIRSGTAQPFVVVRKTLERSFDLPPLAEQTRIADKLDELLSDLDAGVAALERVRSKIKHYRAAVLKAAVEGALTADWRAQHPDIESATDLLARILAERRQRWEEAQLRKFQAQGKTPPKDWKSKYQDPAAPDTTNLPGLPKGWCWATMDQVSSFITSGSRGWAEYYADSGPIFVRSQDIKTDRLILADVAHVTPPESSEGARTRLHRGDLLVTITGANVAKAALVDCEIDEAYVSQHVGMTRFVDVKIGPFIHVYVTASSGGRKLLLKVAYGAGKPGLNLDNLRELPVPLPPLAEQAAIVEAVEAQLSVIDHLEADLEAKLKSAQALRQSILRDAFEGKLVPQDPDDEPAAELLKRIAAARAERATTAAKAAKALEKPAIASTGRGRRRQLNASS